MPLKDRVVVKVKTGERKLPSGLVLIERPYDFGKPDKNDAGTRAMVVAVGPWQDEVGVGDEVLIEKFGGIEFHFEGEDYVMLDRHEILALVDEHVEWIGKSIDQTSG